MQIGKDKSWNTSRKLQFGKYKSKDRNQQHTNRKIQIGKPFTISRASSWNRPKCNTLLIVLLYVSVQKTPLAKCWTIEKWTLGKYTLENTNRNNTNRKIALRNTPRKRQIGKDNSNTSEIQSDKCKSENSKWKKQFEPMQIGNYKSKKPKTSRKL